MKYIRFYRECFDGTLLPCLNGEIEPFNDNITNDEIIKSVNKSSDKWDPNATHFRISNSENYILENSFITSYIKLPIIYIYILDYNTAGIYYHKVTDGNTDYRYIVKDLGFNLDECEYMITEKELFIQRADIIKKE